MPTYLYECQVHGEFEEYHSMSKMLEVCPKCQEAGLEPQKLKQLINCSSKGVVELTGHELIQKTKEDAQKFKKEVYSSEKLYANVLSENNYQNLQTQIDKNKRRS